MKVGDTVWFEVANNPCESFLKIGYEPQPRWDGDYDQGPMGKWVKARVTYVSPINANIRHDSWPSSWSVVKAYLQFGSETETAKNNDGRDTCYACGAPTRPCGSAGFGPNHEWRVCTKCGL